MERVIKLLLVLLLCGVAHAQVTTGGSAKYEQTTATTSINLAGTWTCPANSLILVGIGADQSATGQNISSVALGGVSLTAHASTLVTVNGQFRMQVFYGYTASGLTNPALTATLAQSLTASAVAACFTGTNASAGTPLNGIGSVNATSGNSTGPSVTVTSSGTNNSKYFGFITAVSGSPGDTITKGASYTLLATSAYDGSWVHATGEISTAAVSPAANTAVNGTISTALNWGIAGVEVKVSTGGGSTVVCTRTLMGAGPC